MALPQVKKEKTSNGTAKCKVIRAPGSQLERVAQACDRCRLKKTRCDGKRPQCSQCAAVGFECKVSDRLSRRAFPRGYTETLEERVRELEAENRRLLALLDLRDEQMELYSKVEKKSSNDISSTVPSDFDSSRQPLSSSNLSLLNSGNEVVHKSGCLSLMSEYIDHDPKHVHSSSCGCSNYPHSVNERPVSIAGSVDLDTGDLTDDDALSFKDLRPSNPFVNPNNVSFEQNQAPGLPAAMALAGINGSRVHLATLVAMSVPRSTEETLFIPSLLSKIGEVHGLDSKACFSSASAIAALKDVPKMNSRSFNENSVINFTNINFKSISTPESNLFFSSLKVPPKIYLDKLITVYFQEWGMLVPIIDKNDFLQQYAHFTKSFENRFNDNGMVHKERFGGILIIIVQLALISQKNHNINGQLEQINDEEKEKILYYDYLIHQLINSSIALTCSIQSLQILSLALFYCLNIGDVITSYALRGRVITMAQQLRLHRCPSAVLGNNGSTVSKFQQSERRILFWCIYSLDTFASLQLGVPRLLKDYEIECALPFGNDNLDDDNNINILIVNNSKVPLVGKVCNLSLAVMRYSKVLGNILDSIFKRHTHAPQGSITELTLMHESLLDSWRRDLPSNIKFEIEVNGSLKGNVSNDKVLLLALLYYNAKLLIHLPIIASAVNEVNASSSSIIVQQCTIAMLNILSDLFSKNTYYLPVPMNISRSKSRLALLSAKGALGYTRGGALFQDSKTILTNIVNELKDENSTEIPGNLSKRCIDLVETATNMILSTPTRGNGSPNSGGSGIDSISYRSSIAKKSASSPLKQVETQRSYSSSSQRSNHSPLSTNSTSTNMNSITPKFKAEPNSEQQQLSQMLQQLDNVPPILASSSTANSRVPVDRQRSSSLSQQGAQPQSFQPGHDLVPGQTTQIKKAPSISDDASFDEQQSAELDFAADGSLGLAPWLNFDLSAFDFGAYNVSVNGELTPATTGGQIQAQGHQSQDQSEDHLDMNMLIPEYDVSSQSQTQAQAQAQAQESPAGAPQRHQPRPRQGSSSRRGGSLFDWQNSNLGQ